MEETGIIRQLHKMVEENGRMLREGAHAAKAQIDAMMGRLPAATFRRIYILGCGTSYFGVLTMKGAFEALTGLPSEGAEAFAFTAYQNMDLVDEHCLVLGFSTSGEADAVIDAFAKCRTRKARTVAVTAVPGSSVGRLADEILLTGAADEVSVPRTKAQVQGLIAMYLCAIALGRARGYLSAPKAEGFVAEIDRCIDAVVDAITRVEPIVRTLAKKYAESTAALILGSGCNAGTAQTGALMITEMAWIHSWGDDLENFLHGRFREVNQAEPLLILAPHGEASRKTLDFLSVTRHVDGPTILFTDNPTDAMKSMATHIVQMKGGVSELFSPILYLVPLLLYGYHFAIANGTNPDIRRYPDINPSKARYVEG